MNQNQRILLRRMAITFIRNMIFIILTVVAYQDQSILALLSLFLMQRLDAYMYIDRFYLAIQDASRIVIQNIDPWKHTASIILTMIVTTTIIIMSLTYVLLTNPLILLYFFLGELCDYTIKKRLWSLPISA